jgi:hypothetical protein
VNSLDRKLAKVFKETLKKNGDIAQETALIDLLKNLDFDLRNLVQEIFIKLKNQTDKNEPSDADQANKLLLNLLQNGLNETASVVFIAWLEKLKNLNFERVLSIAPTCA